MPRVDSLTFLHRKNRTLDERLRPWWGTHGRVLATVGFTILILATTLFHYHEFQGKGTPPTRRVRTACSPCAGADLPTYCSLPADYQFDKVIWFITDGYPMYMQRKWLPLYSDHAIPFSVAVPGKKWSHTIYTSWFTGMPNVNLLARPIDGDSVFEAMRRASGQCPSQQGNRNNAPQTALPTFNLHWMGPTWCPVDLLGGAEKAQKELNFVEIDAVTEDLERSPHPYPSIPISALPNILENVANKGQSLIAHTGLIDKAAHYNVPTNKDEQHLHDLFAGPALREFIDAHPEYLLILSSDHGLSQNGKFHGDGKTKASANIGMLTFYNPVFQGQNVSEIDVVDVLPTLSKYLKNVDIAFYSVGEVRNVYGPDDKQGVVNALKQNLMQLEALMVANGDEVNTDTIDRAMNGNDEHLLRDTVRHYKSLLFTPVIRPFYKYTIAFLVVLVLACLVYWTCAVNNNAYNTTFLLAVPLLFSFGFFLKPLTSYLFESNFTFYFGVATSFVVACGFSGWRNAGYLFLNEFFNVVGWLFRHFLAGASAVPFIGILLSLAENLYHIRQQSTPRLRLLPVLFYLHACNFAFLLTANVPAAYVGGLNVFALAIYLSFPALCLLAVVALIRAHARVPTTPPTPSPASHIVEPLTLSLTSALLLLSGGSPLVALFNFQARQILPCLFGKGQFEFAGGPYSVSHRGIQACAVYVLQQAVWVTWFVWGLTPDLDIDVRAGVAGIHSWNEFPILAGLLLGVQKVGVFPLLALHVGAVVIPNLFPLFLYFALTLLNCLSLHLCIKRFTFKTQIESLLIITMCTWLQFLVVLLVKHGVQPEFEDRAPWGYLFAVRVSKVRRYIVESIRNRNAYTRVPNS